MAAKSSLQTMKMLIVLVFSLCLFAARSWSGEVVIVGDEPPAPDDLADVMFPQKSEESRRPKLRGIRFTSPQTPPPAPEPEPGQQAAARDEPPPEEPGGAAVGFNIQFALGSAELLPAALPFIDSVGEMLTLERTAGNRIFIAGHADATGPSEYNQALSEARARAVRDYLVDRFAIDPGRLEIAGYGDTQPLPGTDPVDGINRRVEFQPLQ
jgi:outer membrane protein OmpA-like peptidoglycan-associated protein